MAGSPQKRAMLPNVWRQQHVQRTWYLVDFELVAWKSAVVFKATLVHHHCNKTAIKCSQSAVSQVGVKLAFTCNLFVIISD